MGSRHGKEPPPGADSVVDKPVINATALRLTMKSMDRFKRLKEIKKEASADMSKLPPLKPAKLKKKEFFTPRQMLTAYVRSSSVSKDELLDYDKLTEHLTSKAGSDVEGLWSIYLWMVNIDLFSPDLDGSGGANTPMKDLINVKTGKSDFQLFFKNICTKINQPCMVAEGFTRGDQFIPGCLQANAKSSQDHWIYVHIKGEWRFVHPVLGATAPKKNKSYFFLTDPSEFINFCFPTETRWQLADDPVLWKDFSKQLHCKPNFFAMGLVIVKPRTSELTINNETVNIEISAPTELMDKIILHYKMAGKEVKQFVEKEDTISNDSLPISPYQSTIDLKEDMKDPAYVLQAMFGKQAFKKPLVRSELGGLGGLGALKARLGQDNANTNGEVPNGTEELSKTKTETKQTDDAQTPKTNGEVEPDSKMPAMNGWLMAAKKNEPKPVLNTAKPNGPGEIRSKTAPVLDAENKKSTKSMQSSKVDLKMQRLKFNFARADNPSKLIFGSSVVSVRPAPHPTMYNHKQPHKMNPKMIEDAFKKLDDPPKDTAKSEEAPPSASKEIDTTKFPTHLERYVYLHYGYSRFIFEIELPVTGVYTVEITGDFINFNDVAPDVTKLQTICKFKIEKTGESRSVVELPVVPEVGWGPNPYMTVYGMKPLSHTEGRVIVETNEEMTMQFQLFGTLDLHTMKILTKLRNPAYSAQDLEDKSRHMVVGDTLYVRISLPGKGQFALKIFAKKKGEQGFKNVCNYLLIYGRPDIKNPFGEIKDDKYSKRMLRERLQKAILYGNEAELREARNNFQMHRIPDEGEIKMSTKRLEFFELQKELHAVAIRRHAKTIKGVLARGKASDYAPELRNEITEAENTLSNLERLDGFQFHIGKLDRDILAEMRTYVRPKPIVLDVMRAVCILLGEEEESLATWENIQPHLHKKGNDHLLNRIDNLRVGSLDPSVIDSVKAILGKYEYKEIRESSTNVATFHKWIQDVCDKRQAIIEKERKELINRMKGSIMKAANDAALDKTVAQLKEGANNMITAK